MNIRALQLGRTDFSKQFAVADDTEWNYEPALSFDDDEYDLAIVDRRLTDDEADILSRIVRCYCLFVMDDCEMTSRMKRLMKSREGRLLRRDELGDFFQERIKNFFSRPYGEKMDQHQLTVSPGFRGSVRWNGFTEAVLTGDFGENMHQAAFWKSNIPLGAGQAIDLWLEYKKDPGIEIELNIVQFAAGSVSGIVNTWTFSEEDMKDQVTIESDSNGPVFASINARGEGTLEIISLHDRYSRRGEGSFLPGSRRFVTRSREEIFTYMDPVDLKPPLCVYFSGYKTMEGFEGYRIMRRMQTPFMLISESRLEGGAFYIGSEEYENKVTKAITDAMDRLGFTPDQVILSGLSMGTFGAMYYGLKIRPGHIIIGKPLLSLGSMAKAERIDRPGGFPTSTDLLWKNYHSLNDEAVAKMNRRFWDRFDSLKWEDTTFSIAYMIEDDYDPKAYEKLLSHIRTKGAKVVGKGLHGRHNDDTKGIVKWFLMQYRRTLTNEFDRKQ